jgi:peptide/nickel transport system permease protein
VRAAGLLAIAVLITVATLAAAAPLLARHDPAKVDLAATLGPPSASHPLGHDRLGRDVWSRIVWGSRVSLLVGVSAVGISLVIGTALGLAAGMSGGWTDEVLMRVVDVLLAFPGILLAIALAAVLGPSLTNVVLALSLIGWTGYARLVRAETLAILARPHVEAARAIGAARGRIVLRHVLPLLLAPLTVQATFGFAGAIVAEASLSFLGLGTQPPVPSWGSMLNDGRPFLLTSPHAALFPGLAIFVTVFAVNFLGDELRDRLDVRLTSRRRSV